MKDIDGESSLGSMETIDRIKEAQRLLSKLGRRYYEMEGETSAEKNRLRQPQTKNGKRSSSHLHNDETKGSIIQRIHRPDAMLHYPFIDKDGHVVDVLNENSNNAMSSSFHTISKPGRKKIAVGIFHDFVENGKSRLLLKDIPSALELLGLAVPDEIYYAIDNEYLQQTSRKVFDTTFFNEYKKDDRVTSITLEHWLAMIERCVYVGHQTEKDEFEMQLTRSNERIINDVIKEKASSKKATRNINKNVCRSKSLPSNLFKDTKNSLLRSSNPNGFPREKEDNHTTCDKRAQYMSYTSYPSMASKKFMGAGGVGYDRTYNRVGGEVMRSRGGASPSKALHRSSNAQNDHDYRYINDEPEQQLLISKANRAFKFRQANAMTVNTERSRSPGREVSPKKSPSMQNWLKYDKARWYREKKYFEQAAEDTLR